LALTVDVNYGTYGYKVRIVKVDFDDSYPTGGESLAPSTMGFVGVYAVFAEPKGGYVFEYDYDNEKLKAYYGNYDQGSDGALTEVTNGADLSSVTGVRLVVFGY